MAHARASHQNHPLPQEALSDKAVSRLLSRHEALESQLADLNAAPLVDWDGVKLVKRQKLQVAEQLEQLKRRYQ